ncbi:MAG: hypothetical protein E7223_05410 [Clostridiales bacterium]|nr:hypothetical protein [Clostridiales bacterium]
MENNLGLMERFADPALFEGLSFAEKMAGGGVTLLMGLGITFIVLLILWGCITIMGKVLKTGAPKKEKAAPAPAAAAAVAAAPAPAPAEAAPAPAAEGIDPAIIAVIMAAIAAAEGPEAAQGLVVRRITRVQSGRPAWRTAGVNECLDSRRM